MFLWYIDVCIITFILFLVNKKFYINHTVIIMILIHLRNAYRTVAQRLPKIMTCGFADIDMHKIIQQQNLSHAPKGEFFLTFLTFFRLPCIIKISKIPCNDTRSTLVRKSDHGMQILIGLQRTACFCVSGGSIMPKTKLQRMMFALMTVIITVHAYVFYSLYVVNGTELMNVTDTDSVIGAVNAMGGVYMLGRNLPIWAVVIVEFLLAYTLEITVGSPLSFRLAVGIFDPIKTHPVLFETAVICATVGIMCPSMSFLAAILYYPYYNGFAPLTLLAEWIRLICLNFPFAFFSQLFFIQPLVRTLFKFCMSRTADKNAVETTNAAA